MFLSTICCDPVGVEGTLSAEEPRGGVVRPECRELEVQGIDRDIDHRSYRRCISHGGTREDPGRGSCTWSSEGIVLRVGVVRLGSRQDDGAEVIIEEERQESRPTLLRKMKMLKKTSLSDP